MRFYFLSAILALYLLNYNLMHKSSTMKMLEHVLQAFHLISLLFLCGSLGLDDICCLVGILCLHKNAGAVKLLTMLCTEVRFTYKK